MKTICTSNNRVFIVLLKDALTDNDIPCLIKNYNPPAAGEIPASVAWPEVCIINNKDYEKAKSILETIKKELKNSSAWHCPQCNELLAPEFNQCWKCGAVKTTEKIS